MQERPRLVLAWVLASVLASSACSQTNAEVTDTCAAAAFLLVNDTAECMQCALEQCACPAQTDASTMQMQAAQAAFVLCAQTRCAAQCLTTIADAGSPGAEDAARTITLPEAGTAGTAVTEDAGTSAVAGSQASPGGGVQQ